MRFLHTAFVFTLLVSFASVNGQSVREYTVKRYVSAPVVDGRLDEPDWRAAPFTEPFVLYADGAPAGLTTRSKFLWDGSFLYIGFACGDPDVWALLRNRDDHLWNGEVVEILCDPDGDGRNYFEVQVNPLGTVLDLLMDKPYSTGGAADLGWNLIGLQSAVSVSGTLNLGADADTAWTCEIGLPFPELAFLAPSRAFPPASGDSWRILVTRYDYERTGDRTVEVTAWNRTDSRGFHVPEKFGRIIFSDEAAASSTRPDPGNPLPRRTGLVGNYPNPFNPSTTLLFDLVASADVFLAIIDVGGREVTVLMNESMPAGRHGVKWDGNDGFGKPVASGMYLACLRVGERIDSEKMLLTR